MSSGQFEEKEDEPTIPESVIDDDNESPIEISDEAFKKAYHVRSVYTEICREYDERIVPKFVNLTRAKAQFPPYWDEEKNKPQDLPLYQHNVSSGRYQHSITQLALSYNSFFPNQSYSKSLIEVKLYKEPFDMQPQEQSTEKKSPNVPKQSEADQAEYYLHDNAKLIQQAYDNIIKLSKWAKREHLKMTSDLLHYGVGIYFFNNPKSYRYKAIDFREVRFPSGSSIDPDEWEYVFVKHDISFNEIYNKYKKSLKNENSPSGWKHEGLEALTRTIINQGIQTGAITSIGNSRIEQIDSIREGLSSLNFSKVCPARIPVVSCYWKTLEGKICCNTFASPSVANSTDDFIFEKDNFANSFSEIFSIFPADDSEDEIRMVKGWGEKIHPLCHAYDRGTCKFLDHLEYTATLFLSMDPNDIHKKILHFGSINIGKFEDVKNFPSALKGIVEGLIFLDSKIDALTFTRGLNKTEMMGEGRGAELASILLNMEGRVHKHLSSRFGDHYTGHHAKVLSKVLKICNTKSELSLDGNKEVEAKFYDYLTSRGVPKKLLQLDNTSELNDNLPSDWGVQARKPDGSAITSCIPYVMQSLQPYLSSLPESGFKYILARLLAETFGDEDIIQKILPGSDLAKLSSEADLQTAEMQAAILTSQTSDFDKELSLSQDVNPEMSDVHKFVTFPSSQENDHVIFLQVFLSKVDDISDRFNRREIGRPTMHIWLYNLVSTAQGHVQDLRQDQIRSSRSESANLFQRFGLAFNLLRQVESQANAEKAKKLDALQKDIQSKQQNDPKMLTAMAKVEEARAKNSKIALDFASNRIKQALEIQKNKRESEAHILDSRLKLAQIDATRKEALTQSLAGRPGANDQ